MHSYGSVAGGDASLAAVPDTEDLSPAGPSQPTHALPEPESDTHAGHSVVVHVASDTATDQAMQQSSIAVNETTLQEQPFQHVESDIVMHVATLHPDNADLSALRHQLDQPAADGVAMQLQTQPPASSLPYTNTEAAPLSAKPSKECILDPATATASCSSAQPTEQSHKATLPASQQQAVLEAGAQQPARQPRCCITSTDPAPSAGTAEHQAHQLEPDEPSDAAAVGGPPGTLPCPQPAHEPDGAEATPVLQMLTDSATAHPSSVSDALPIESQDDGKCDAASAGPASMAHLTASDSQAPSAMSDPSQKGSEHPCVARQGAVPEVHAQHVEVSNLGDAQCSALTRQDSHPPESSAEAHVQSPAVTKGLSMHNMNKAAARPLIGGQPSLPLFVAPQHAPEQAEHSIRAAGPASRAETDVKLLGCAVADTSAAHVQKPPPLRDANASPAASKAAAQQQPQPMCTKQQQQHQQEQQLQAMSTKQQQQQQQPQAVSTRQPQPQAMSAEQQMTWAGPAKPQTQAESTKQAHAVLTRQQQQQQRAVTVRQQQPRAILTRQQRQLLGSEQQQPSLVAVRPNSRWPDAKVTSMSLRSKKRKHDSWSSDQDVSGDSTGVIGGSDQRKGPGSYATRSRFHMPSVVSPEHRCTDARSNRVRYA